ncbi:MAG: hypothetical protein GF405_07350 [Candidatus Eisenbacteria bacterium]|nr:hypothetical protein [Candidatus Eisenbacteria bacterium]
MRRDGPRDVGGRRRLRTRFAVSALLLVLAGFAAGYLVHRGGLTPSRVARRMTGGGPAPNAFRAPDARGRWHRPSADPSDLSDSERAELTRLLTVGYLDGSVPAPDATGVTVHEVSRTWDGLNLVVSGHEPAAFLMTMDGEIVHSWSCSFHDVWPESRVPDERLDTQFWRRAHLCPNGDLLALFDWLGLVRLDASSSVLWSYDGGSHHDIDVADDGRILVLDQEARLIPRLGRERPVLEEFVSVLTPDGEPIRRVSILEAIERSDYAPLLERLPEGHDILHTNTIELLDGRLAGELPAFEAGNVLISIRSLDAVAVVDLERGEVVWVMTGMWNAQHQPTVLGNGNLLIFDNLAGDRRSRVLEFDPLTREVVWRYPEPGEGLLWSETCGSNQRLPNGNTLITESDNGRAIEVTVEGEIVWEYVNPHRAGPENELIATLLEVVRIPSDGVSPRLVADGSERRAKTPDTEH